MSIVFKTGYNWLEVKYGRYKKDIVINDDLGEVSDAGLSEELDLDEAGVDLAVVPEKPSISLLKLQRLMHL